MAALPDAMPRRLVRHQGGVNSAVGGSQALALRVVADKLKHGEVQPEPVDVSFTVAAA
jgi:hypothetical protein